MNGILKNKFKDLADMVFLIVTWPFFLLFLAVCSAGHRDRVFWGFSQFLSLIPGTIGNYIRKSFYRLSMARCDRHCAILFGTIFAQTDTEIGHGVYIGPNCNIGSSAIQDHCTLGSGVHIMSGKKQHNFDSLNVPIQQQGGVLEKVVIGEDTWIGNCALIMANVGRKCVIGAGSVVTRDVPDYAVVAGNPAVVIRMRENQP